MLATTPTPDEVKKTKLTRRRWLRRIAVYGGMAAVGLYTWRIEPQWIELVERPLPIKHLPAALEGKKLLQLSDLHIGPRVDSDYIRRTLVSANQLNPDLVVITGDFMTYSDDSQIDEVCHVLKQLQMPALGCYAILGNHDYGQGWKNGRVADLLSQRLTDLGIRVLRNEMTTVQGLQLIGVDDLWGPNYDAVKALKSINKELPVLALCHNPDAQDLVEWKRYEGWVLAGHTHGGQCKPPFLPPPMLPVMNRRYTSGAFDMGNGRQLYINRGVGYLMRVRFNARPEMTLFQLTTTI